MTTTRDSDRSMIDEQDVNRMRWASRRGMLELDLVLEPFVSDRYAALSDADKIRYRDLMLCEDQELFGWFLKREVPDDPELAAIVRTILEYARTPPELR
ncbi:MAG: succinate dehydrogenase assembly factor 2 [Halioglobus sp.]